MVMCFQSRKSHNFQQHSSNILRQTTYINWKTEIIHNHSIKTVQGQKAGEILYPNYTHITHQSDTGEACYMAL